MMASQPKLLARVQFALAHVCWPHWCRRHRIPYVSDFCPECNGARLTRLEVVDDRNIAAARDMPGEEAALIGLERVLAFDIEEVRRYVRGRRRNGLHRALADGEIGGR